MRTPITLHEFLFTLNQDEDVRVTIIDYMRDERIMTVWKSSLTRIVSGTYGHYKGWFVQDFVLSYGGVEITIVELPEELD